MRSVSMVLSGRQYLAHLFDNHTRMRVVIDAILQGHCGTVEADMDAQVAQLSLGPLTILGGDPSHPAAREIVEFLQPWTTVVAEDGWRDLLMQIRGGAIITSQRTSFSPAGLYLPHLHELAWRTPGGFEIRPIDAALAEQVPGSVSPDLIMSEVFASPADLAERGIGFCVTKDGRVAAAAVAGAMSDGAITVRTASAPAYRELGLDTAAAAALVSYCLENGIEPHWDAEDAASIELAETLGYTANGAYDVHTVAAETLGGQHASHLFADESVIAAG